MFEVGFTELLLLFVLALLVLGPERLPRVASQVGRWIGRARGMARQFREQLEREVQIDDPYSTLDYPKQSSASKQDTTQSSTTPGAGDAEQAQADAQPQADPVSAGNASAEPEPQSASGAQSRPLGPALDDSMLVVSSPPDDAADASGSTPSDPAPRPKVPSETPDR